MKILHALGWYYPQSLGGTEVYVAELAKWQMAEGHQVVVVAPLAGHSNSVQSYEHDGVRVFRYPIPQLPSRDEAQNVVRADGSAHFDRIVEDAKPDIVHFHTFTTGMSLGEVKAAKASGARVVATNHLGSLGYICQRGSLMAWGAEACDGKLRVTRCAACALHDRGLSRPLAYATAIAGHVVRNLPLPQTRAGTALGMTQLISRNKDRQKAILGELDRFVLLSESALDMVALNDCDRDRLAVNYLGTSHANATRKPGPDQRPATVPIRVGYVGRIALNKGVIDLARAFTQLDRSLPIELEFCAPLAADESRAIAAEIKTLLGDDERIHFAGAVPHSDIPARLASYDVLCVPSLTFEGGPTVIHEARAVGTPVVGTSIGAIPELVRHDIDGAIFPVGDWRALAGIFQSIVANPAGTVDLWRRNLRPPRSMDDVARDYAAMYETLLSV